MSADTVGLLTVTLAQFEHDYRRREAERATHKHGKLHSRQVTGPLAHIVGGG